MCKIVVKLGYYANNQESTASKTLMCGHWCATLNLVIEFAFPVVMAV